MRSASRLVHLLLPAAILILLCGCAQMNLKKPSWPFASEDKPGTPVRIVPIWTDTVLYEPNQAPQRGFGGRLMFYDVKNDKPIKVDGDLVVYAFDETGRDPTNTRPDRKFVFPRHLLELHYSKSQIGHSYNFWLPWDEMGGEQKDISLIARFVPADGPTVAGEPTKQRLPGKPPQLAAGQPGSAPRPTSTTNWQTQARPVSYEAPVAAGQDQKPADHPARRMQTTTIPVRGTFTRQQPNATNGSQPSRQIPSATLQQVIPYPTTPQGPAAGTGAQQPRPQQATPAPQGSLPPQARYSPAQYPPQAGPIVPPGPDRTPWQPGPGASPYGPLSQSPRATGL
jgi:hypothetical protein